MGLTRQQRAIVCAVGIVPTTIAGVALVRCGCAQAAYIIELLTFVCYLVWIRFA
jgi:hypothetical protein